MVGEWGVNPQRLMTLLARERSEHHRRNPRALALADAPHLLGGVPMTWMNKWYGGFPLILDQAHGNRVRTIDGHEYLDLALGDTGAMAGHSPAPVVAAVLERFGTRGGATTMLPTEDAAPVAAELAHRFGLPRWSFTLTATDANRWALRIARHLTGRQRILAFAYGYHGSVDETLVIAGSAGRTLSRPGNVGAPNPVDATTRVAEFNDEQSVLAALRHGDIACIITEPALTNIGIVLPEPGFLEFLRAEATAHGALLLIDETHTISAGPGGATAAWGLQPDIVTIGKAIGGGIPAGAYGLSADLAERILGSGDADLVDVGGVGGTLAGNALSVAAMRATLTQVLTDEAFTGMIACADQFTAGVAETLARTGVPWSITQLGARAEYRFTHPAPRTGTAAALAGDDGLDEYLHLFMANRGVLMTPFHNMALMCPATTLADVAVHTRLFADAVADLIGTHPTSPG